MLLGELVWIHRFKQCIIRQPGLALSTAQAGVSHCMVMITSPNGSALEKGRKDCCLGSGGRKGWRRFSDTYT